MLAAVVAIAVVTVVNVLGTRWGGRLQVFGTALKVGALGAMIVLPWVLGKVHVPNLSPVWPVSSKGFFTHFMIGMVGVLWTYNGWVNTSNLAEEIRDPGRNLPRSIIGGVLILITLYLLMTLAYHLVLPMDEIRLASTERGSPRPSPPTSSGPCWASGRSGDLPGGDGLHVHLAQRQRARRPPRVLALARDGLFPHFLCRIHPRFQTPSHAVVTQAAWAIALTVAGSLLIAIPPPSTGWPEPVRRAWTTLHHGPCTTCFTPTSSSAPPFFTCSASPASSCFAAAGPTWTGPIAPGATHGHP